MGTDIGMPYKNGLYSISENGDVQLLKIGGEIAAYSETRLGPNLLKIDSDFFDNYCCSIYQKSYSRKRARKLLMSSGIQRNDANKIVEWINKNHKIYNIWTLEMGKGWYYYG